MLLTDEKLKMKELELESLFGVINYINSNASEGDLYRLFTLTVRADVAVGKLALFVNDEKRWSCKVNYGSDQDYLGIKFNEDICDIATISRMENRYEGFEEFEIAIPIKHKDKKLAYLLLTKSNRVESEERLDINFLKALCSIILVAIENKKLARREQKQQAYQQQLKIASKVQNMLFPKKLPYNKKIKFHATYIPHHTVGGDYYDFIKVDKDRFLFCIADVSGKGIPAALLMSNFQASVRVLARYKPDLRYMIEELNKLILSNSDGEHFITAFLGLYDMSKAELRYLNAGHIPPLLVTEGKIHSLAKGTTVLGGLPFLPFIEDGLIENLHEYTILCVTDGITETTNHLGEEFDEGLKKFLEENHQLPPKELHEMLLNKLNMFQGKSEYSDDITVFSCRVGDGEE